MDRRTRGQRTMAAGAESMSAEPGMLFRFEPNERHSVSSPDGARILLLLTPWPGEGHYRGLPDGSALRESTA